VGPQHEKEEATEPHKNDRKFDEERRETLKEAEEEDEQIFYFVSQSITCLQKLFFCFTDALLDTKMRVHLVSQDAVLQERIAFSHQPVV
jgi:hypothetical protein